MRDVWRECERHFSVCGDDDRGVSAEDKRSSNMFPHVEILIQCVSVLLMEAFSPAGFSVSIQALHPSEEHLKANYVTMPCKGCPNSKAPADAAHRSSFFSLFFEDAPLLSFAASQKGKKEKMATFCGVDRHFRGPGRQKSWRKGKTFEDATRKCSKG